MIKQKSKMTDVGDVKVHNNAIKSITELTISKIKGVVRINKGPFRKALDCMGLGKTLNIMSGIRVESGESNTKITLDIITAYDMNISEVATRVQDEVKQAVESMTGIPSVEVYVNVVGVEQE